MSTGLREELKKYISSLTDKMLDRYDLQIKIEQKFGEDSEESSLIELMTGDVVDIHRDLSKILEKYDEDEDEDDEEEDYNYNSDYKDQYYKGLNFCGKCGKLITKSI